MSNRSIVRLTASQERFEVLWKKRMEGEPTLKELTEMDEIINRDPLIHQFVLKEMENWALPPHNDEHDMSPPSAASPLKKLIDRVKSFFKRSVTFFMSEASVGILSTSLS